MPQSAELQWFPIATVFPASLDSDTDPSSPKFKDGMTPDAYGLGLDSTGLLYKASIAPGTVPFKKTYTVGLDEWTWYLRRLWRAVSANLEYNSPEYTASILYQDIGKVSFDEDANPIVDFFPFARGSMYVGKSTGGYHIPNADSFGGEFQHDDVEPAMAVSAAGNGLSMNGIAYVSNTNGLMVWDGMSVKNLTITNKNILSVFQNKTLTMDIPKRRIIGGTSFIYDVDTQGLFRYDGSNFRFTTRTIATRRIEPISCRQVSFVVYNPNGVEGSIKYQLRGDESDWRTEESASVVFTPNKPYKSFVVHTPIAPPNGRRLAMRITDMPDGLYIESIRILTNFQTTEGSYTHG